MVKKYILVLICVAIFVYLNQFDATSHVQKSIHSLKRAVRSVHFLNALSEDAQTLFLIDENSPKESAGKMEILVTEVINQALDTSDEKEALKVVSTDTKKEGAEVAVASIEPQAPVAPVAPVAAQTPIAQVAPVAAQTPIAQVAPQEPQAEAPKPAAEPVVENAKPAEPESKPVAGTCETGPAVNPIVEQITKTYLPDCNAEQTADKIADTGPSDAQVEIVTPVEAEPEQQSEQEDVVQQPLLRGVVLLSRNETDRNLMPNSRIVGFVARDLYIPDGIKTLKNELEPEFLDKPIDIDLVDDLKRAIAVYYSEHDRPLVTIEIPDQDVTDGILDVIVNEAKLGQIVTRGNYWFSDDKIKKFIRLKRNDSISRERLLADISYMNKNPFRHTDVIFTPGGVEGQTDLELVTKDRFPLRFYGGVDNTGTVPLGQDRFFSGFNWGDAFGLDQTLTYQATVSFHVHRFFSNTINYVAPLPWRHVLQIYGGYATIRPEIESFKSSGHSFQGSLRYQMPKDFPFSASTFESVLGFDIKNTNNFLAFTEKQEIAENTSSVNIMQFVLGFNYSREFTRDKFTFSSEVFISPGEIMARDSNHDYSKLRHGAKSSYVYGRLYFYNDYRFCNSYVFSAQARFQASSEALLPSEQFGLGGYDTVRGYDEREVNGDSAICVNLEMRTPNLPIFRRWRCENQEFILLGFADYGFAYDIRVANYPHGQQLASIGAGARYRYSSYISGRIDCGYRLVKITNGQDTGFKTHFGVIVSY